MKMEYEREEWTVLNITGAWDLFINMRDPYAFLKAEHFIAFPYYRRALELYFNYKSNIPFINKANDFMTYSICLYYVDHYRKNIIKVLKNRINEKVEIKTLNKITQMDFKNTLESFYFEIRRGLQI